MTLIEYITIAATWLFVNVFGKLLINSVERLYKDKIDQTVLKIPAATRWTAIELLRSAVLTFFAPVILLASIAPSKIQNGLFKEVLYLRQLLFSPQHFRERVPLFWLFLKHPVLWLNPKAHSEEISQLITKLFSEGKYHPMAGARLTSRSS